MAASSDYSRRRQRKSAIDKFKVSNPKGFVPKPHAGTRSQKKDQSCIEEKVVDDSGKSKLDIKSSISSSTVERRVRTPEEVEEDTTDVEFTFDKEASAEIPSTPFSNVNNHRQKTDFEEDWNGLKTHQGVISYGDESVAELESWNELEVITNGARDCEVNSQTTSLFVSSSDVKSSKSGNMDDVEYTQDHVERRKLTEDSLVEDSVKEDQELKAESDVDKCEDEEPLVKQKEPVDLQAQRKLLEDLAEENLTRGNKVFVLPEVVKADREIEVFLNRSLSSLVDDHEVFIKGAFNGWRWQSFTEKLHKTDLRGDWWSCHLYVPKEAYQVDFVFFNGSNVYENNSLLDFLVPVEGGLDESGFENFLFEEKQRELERLAIEKAERERQAEEQREREAERVAIEADQAQAKVEVQKKREAIHHVMKLATKSVDNLWHIEPDMFKGEDKVRLYYNRSTSPLQHATEIWIHGGYNNWIDGLSFIEKLHRSEKGDGDWWYAEVVIPDGAQVLDWVFADGLPHKARVYDNNNYKDFRAIVPKVVSEELYWVEEEHRIYRKLQEERKLKEEAARRKVEKTALMKAQTKEESMKRFLLSQKNILYTDPLIVQAGKLVSVLYKPSSTVLSGKPEVWFRCSFNRWTHYYGPLPPQKMEPSENGVHVKVTVKIPMDAYMMDFVFSEKENGGIYDNNNGMDYHIPVVGGIMKEPPMHVVHVAVEMAPIAKVGGLGDVVTSLSRAVQELGHKVDIIFPKYDCMNFSNVKDFHFCQSFHWGGTEIKVWFGKVEDLSVYFLEPLNGMFNAGCIYGRNNDGDRFGFFSRAALEFLLQRGMHPDIIHCHDWSTAPVAWLFKEHYRHCRMNNARVIFTIHNLEFGVDNIAKAMQYADKATTVSQTYAKEVSGNPAISPHLNKFHGIVNGIDPDIWDPYNDNFIPVAYTSENVVEGKRAAKEALQQRLGLRKHDYPLVGIITRLTAQKGIHLIKHAIERTLERNGQVVLLGSAPDARIQNEFVNLANLLHSSHADRARLCLAYDEPLSHLIYAGSDFILVPSLFEPCGLTQLVAMRYGAIPVVRKTGGLYDTVFDVDNDKGRAQAQGLEPNGFSFDGADAGSVDYALNRAIASWHNGREWFNSLCKRVMDQDWSWNSPALNYIELYLQAHK